ncbi:hypothetical protein EF912_21615 [Streptomyces sp. WAC07061]|uniref:hypothetical protein n=1 Tax=Streptomyces sp. WAC07061 TaxID=2487410 RepID=UPI000F7A8C8C|nr:hypothetical protein [Streptomyces sp. WAC07061]RSS50693.1 hypothetical protein EF912_21615 [Streptomyces sp. WAC07061]
MSARPDPLHQPYRVLAAKEQLLNLCEQQGVRLDPALHLTDWQLSAHYTGVVLVAAELRPQARATRAMA